MGNYSNASNANKESKSNHQSRRKRKVCSFCANKIENINYISISKEIEKNGPANYERSADKRPRYITEKGKIIPRRMSGVCVRHQRLLAKAIKQARVMALLPYKAD
jgi:small subunit ribosomal protein S18